MFAIYLLGADSGTKEEEGFWEGPLHVISSKKQLEHCWTDQFIEPTKASRFGEQVTINSAVFDKLWGYEPGGGLNWTGYPTAEV